MRQKQADLFHVGLNAADEERVGYTQSGHERMEGVLKRRRKKIEIVNLITLLYFINFIYLQTKLLE